MLIKATRSYLLAVLVWVLCAVAPSHAQTKQIRVAAAADLQTAMPEIVQAFESQTGTHVELIFGSSGNFFAQILNGAPFDVFFSADISYPQKLEASGFTLPNTRTIYGLGRISLWMPANAACEPSRDHWKCLTGASVRQIAIANPAHAPYGRAAVAALTKAGIYDQIKSKIVFGENISQAAQFAQSGNAPAAILAYSLTLSPALRTGKIWEVPAELYPPIEQAAVALRATRNPEASRAFLKFVTQGPGRSILDRYGFRVSPPPIKAERTSSR